MKNRIVILMTMLVFVLLMLMAFPVMAQQASPLDTITVIGTGSASGLPDIANLEIGVETVDQNLSEAYNTTNVTIDGVIAALVEAGVAREDIRTVGLNVYQDRYGGPNPVLTESGEPTPMYSVSNNVLVTVRDIENVANVLNTAIDAGATSVYGLNFAIEDQMALASEARAEALENARAKAQELADLTDVELREILIISEVNSGFDPYNRFANQQMMGGGGGGGAAIEPGRLSVNVNLQVTFRMVN